MELALHIRNIEDTHLIDAIGEHLGPCRNHGEAGQDSLGPAHRIYVGDEFCPIRLPAKKALVRFCQFASVRGLGLTLLTPVLTDIWLDRLRPLFDTLAGQSPQAEVVVNDIGVLHFLKSLYPAFRLSLGRLLNKGFKDPRLSTGGVSLAEEVKALLSGSTFDHPEFREILAGFGVRRVERDLMPHAAFFPGENPGHKTSWYFPFGYVTTGRVCWTSTFAPHAGADYKPLYQCARPCEDLSFELDCDTVKMALRQVGNTVFYRYPKARLSALIKHAEQHDDRLVYQGLLS